MPYPGSGTFAVGAMHLVRAETWARTNRTPAGTTESRRAARLCFDSTRDGDPFPEAHRYQPLYNGVPALSRLLSGGRENLTAGLPLGTKSVNLSHDAADLRHQEEPR